MLFCLISLAALCALCVFFAALPGVRGGAAPLLAVSCVMVLFSLAGIAGLGLVPAAWAFLAGAVVLAVGTLRRGGAAVLRRLCSPGFALFLGGGLVLLLWLVLRQPLLSEWDEFVFWGVAPKLLKTTDTMYTLADVGFRWTSTEFPGLPMLGWFAGAWMPNFAPWSVYWGYGLLYLACGAALCAPFGWRRWQVALPVAVVALLVPFFFTVPYHTTYFYKTWLSAYADLPAGMLFGGALALYLGARHTGRALWQPVPVLCALALTKQNVFPLALVAAGVMAADCLVFGTGRQGFGRLGRPGGQGVNAAAQGGAPRFLKAKNNEGPLPGGAAAKVAAWAVQGRGAWPGRVRRVLAAAGYFAAPVAVYLLWQRHAAWAVSLNPFYGGNQTNEPVSAALAQAVREMLGQAPKSQAFYRVLGQLADSFLGRQLVDGSYQHNVYKVSMAGTGLLTLLLVAALFGLAALLGGPARRRLRVGLCGGLLLCGFAAYHFMLFVVYGYFAHTRDEGIFDYARYTNSYMVGFFMAGVLLLALAGLWHRGRRGALAGQVLVLALACAMLLRCGALVRPGYTVLDYPADAYAREAREEAAARAVLARVVPGSRLFFVCQGGDGGAWMRWHYHLLPGAVLEYSITGGGSLLPPATGTPDDPGLMVEDIRAYLADYGCDYILIDALDEGFATHYGALFDGGLAQPPATPALYHRTAGGQYALVADGAALAGGEGSGA